MSQFIPARQGNDCPICGDTSGDCRHGDGLILCHSYVDCDAEVAGWRYVKPSKTGIWGVYIPDDGTRYSQSWQDAIEERHRRQANRAQQKAKVKASPSIPDRIAGYRTLLDQLTLDSDHADNLKTRGLSITQIQEGLFRSVQPGQPLQGVPANLPGMSWDGRSFWVSDRGFLVPVFDIKGQVIAFQLRRDQVTRSKYRWLKSKHSSHLPSGELPITTCRPAGLPTGIGFIEGILKPYVAAQLSGLVFIGAAGGQFEGSPEQLKVALAALSAELETKTVTWFPDAGSVANRSVYRRDCRTVQLLQRWGYEVRVADWGQFWDKTVGDFDELLASGRSCSQFISARQYLDLQATEKPLNRSHDPKKRTWTRRIWQQLRQLYADIAEKYQLQPQTENASECLAIVPYRGVTTLDYEPGNLPSPEAWQAIGRPKVIFQAGQRRQLNLEAYQKGYGGTLDRSRTGFNKSYESGLYQYSDFIPKTAASQTDTHRIPRLWYIATDHKNPTTETVERNFEDFVSRHNGESLDSTRLTPLGNPYRTRTPPGQTADLPGNCPDTHTFVLANELKDLSIYGGKDSPICTRCLQFSNCEFLQERQRQLKTVVHLRSHINQLPISSQQDIAIIDEPSTQLLVHKSTTASLKDIEATAWRLSQKDPHAYQLIEPFLSQLYQRLQQLKQIPRYGYSHRQVVTQILPSVQEIYDALWKKYQRQWLDSHVDVWTIPGLAELEQALAQAQQQNLDALLQRCYTPETRQAAILDWVLYNWLTPILQVLTGQDKNTHLQVNSNGQLMITRANQRHQRLLSSFGFVMMMDATMERVDAIRKSGIKNLLEIEQYTPKDAFSNVQFTIVRGLGKNPKGSKAETTLQRLNAAIAALIAKHPEIPHQKMALISLKNDLKHFRHHEIPTGYWYRDSRGTNRFTQTLLTIVHGLPKPNLSDKAAEWHAMTGEVVEPTHLSGRYGSWYRAQVLAELIQLAGRPRGHLRKEEQIEVVFLAGDALSERDISAVQQQFPGSTVETIDACDLVLEAASKGVQKERQLVAVIWELMESGIKPKIDRLAETLQITKGRVSQIAKTLHSDGFRGLIKSLVFLLEALKEKTKPFKLDAETLWIAQTYLPKLAKELDTRPLESVMEDFVTIVSVYGFEQFQQMVAATPPWVLTRFLRASFQGVGEGLLNTE